MRLNEEQKAKLMARINELVRDKQCELCGGRVWAVDDILFEMREFHGPRTVLGSGAIKPLITMTCTNCANTKMLSAIQLGMVDLKDPLLEEKKGGQNG